MSVCPTLADDNQCKEDVQCFPHFRAQVSSQHHAAESGTRHPSLSEIYNNVHRIVSQLQAPLARTAARLLQAQVLDSFYVRECGTAAGWWRRRLISFEDRGET